MSSMTYNLLITRNNAQYDVQTMSSMTFLVISKLHVIRG